MRSSLCLIAVFLSLTPRVAAACKLQGEQRLAHLSLAEAALQQPAPEPSARDERLFSSEEVRKKQEAEKAAVHRVMAELLGGSVLGTVGVFTGGLTGLLLTCSEGDCHSLTVIAVSLGLGTSFLTPLGVYLAGRMAKGKGGFVPALVGSVVAASAGAITVVSLGGGLEPVVVALIIGPLVGSILGYEWSNAFSPELRWRRTSAVSAPVKLIPIAGVARGGTGVLGLAGRF